MKLSIKIKKQKKEVEFVDNLYKKLLNELAIILNDFHRVNWKTKSWEILIGPWLNRYVAIVIDRYRQIGKGKFKNNTGLKKKILKYSLAASDISEFTLNIQNAGWNEYFISRIKKILIRKKVTPFLKLKKDKNSITEYSFTKKIIFSFLKLVHFILCFNNKFIFYKPYFGKSLKVIKLFISIKEFPFIYDKFLDDRWYFQYNKNLRKKIKISLKYSSVEEKIIRSLLIESIPTIYVEGFRKINNLVYKVFFPKKVKVIFTAAVLKDNLFKFWMASQISRGVKLIVKQHGVNYGQISKWDNEKHEINICNKYLTYGWNYNNKKTFSSCNFYSFKTKNYKNLEKKNILIVPDDVRFFKTNNIIFDNNILNILKVYDGFLKKFKKNELNNIYFKSHPLSIKSNFYLENYLKKKYKINYLDYNINLNNIFDNFKLIIFFYNSTEFLNLIDSNKPAIFINNKFFYKTLSKSAIPMFNILKKNNIYFDNIANAHKLLGRKDLNKWWDSKKISKVRAVFKDQFSNSNEKNYLSTIKYLKKIKIN